MRDMIHLTCPFKMGDGTIFLAFLHFPGYLTCHVVAICHSVGKSNNIPPSTISSLFVKGGLLECACC